MLNEFSIDDLILSMCLLEVKKTVDNRFFEKAKKIVYLAAPTF
jgi:hypothetical protein